MFIGIGFGTTIGAFLNYVFSRHYPELIKRWKGFPPPEERLYGAMLGSSLLVIGIFWLGWTGQYAAVPWYVPGLSTIVKVCTAIALIFVSFLVSFLPSFSTCSSLTDHHPLQSFLVDTYL